MPSPHRKLNNRLWITRAKRGLSRKKLAALIGHRSSKHLGRWETGRRIPTLRSALLLGCLLQTPVEFLFKDLRDELLAQVTARRGRDEVEANEAESGERFLPLAPNRTTIF